jgi:small-conductance mechanosensitive channel
MDIFSYLDLSFIFKYWMAIVVFFGTFILIKSIKVILTKYLKEFAKKTTTTFDDHLAEAIDKLGFPFYFAVSLYLTTHYFLVVQSNILDVVDKIFLLVIVYYVVRWSQKFVDFFTDEIIRKKSAEEPDADQEILHIGNQFVKYVIWIIAILFVLSNFGVEIGPLLAGASIGGIAIAFALQSILSDIFASFSIYFDKPFRVGDFIVVGQDAGTVKKIGIKSTRLVSLQGEEIVISNKYLTENRINNFKKMEKRRAVFRFGVTYNTPLQKLKKIPQIVKDIISSDPELELDRVNFISFGDFSLVYEVAFFVKSNKYSVYTAKQEQINLKLIEEFRKNKIEFAFPTSTIYLHKIN